LLKSSLEWLISYSLFSKEVNEVIGKFLMIFTIIIRRYFQNLAEAGVADIEPENILNMDETCVVWMGPEEYVICPRSKKYARKLRVQTKSSVTVAFTIAANGDMLPGYVVFKSALDKPCESWTNTTKFPMVVATSPSGWMTSNLLVDYFNKVCCILLLFFPEVIFHVVVHVF
jgi:hypothetical protein